MKLSHIILKEYREFDQQEKELQKKVETSLSQDYNISVSLGAYAGDRADDDPLKGKGFGEVSFYEKEDIPEEEFGKAIDVIKSSGYEVDLSQSTRFYDYEPGERDYYPKIKFKFTVN